eukprot:15365703-Ditylum_brightwellii.AAC.1
MHQASTVDVLVVVGVEKVELWGVPNRTPNAFKEIVMNPVIFSWRENPSLAFAAYSYNFLTAVMDILHHFNIFNILDTTI